MSYVIIAFLCFVAPWLVGIAIVYNRNKQA